MTRSNRRPVILGAELPLYHQPQLYDIAFGFRDVPAECDGILKLALRHGLRAPKSILELACGPGHHLREFAKRGLQSHGLDINEDMLQYARQLCKRDGITISQKHGVWLRRGDMRTFRTNQRYDLVLCLFDSFALCVSDRDAIAALHRAAAALKRNGLVFIELSHPSDYIGRGRTRTMDTWTERQGEISVKTRFSVTRVDPVAETFVARLLLVARNGKKREKRLEMRWPQRIWWRSGMEYIAAVGGCFDIAGWYGDLDPSIPLSTRADAWRMIAVLKRR